jgi:drug/metabolite transporter (DMT)-like permease
VRGAWYLEPLVSVVGAVSLLGERISAAMIVGGVLVLAGVGVTWSPQRDPPAGELPRRG